MSVNQVFVEMALDKVITVGQLWHYKNRVVMVIRITVPNDDQIAFEKDYYAITSFETGWVGYLSDSIQELENILKEESYQQVKDKVTIVPD